MIAEHKKITKHRNAIEKKYLRVNKRHHDNQYEWELIGGFMTSKHDVTIIMSPADVARREFLLNNVIIEIIY
jgi:hypothetical protein